jgi:hypothetical protein
MNALLAVWQADVLRWHCHPDRRLRYSNDTIQGHSARMIQMLFVLIPDPSLALVRAIAFHDSGESGIGDVSGGAKRRRPVLASEIGEAEMESRNRLGIPAFNLTDAESLVLKILDELDSYLWMRGHAPDIAVSDGWLQQKDRILFLSRGISLSEYSLSLIVAALT